MWTSSPSTRGEKGVLPQDRSACLQSQHTCAVPLGNTEESFSVFVLPGFICLGSKPKVRGFYSCLHACVDTYVHACVLLIFLCLQGLHITNSNLVCAYGSDVGSQFLCSVSDSQQEYAKRRGGFKHENF